MNFKSCVDEYLHSAGVNSHNGHKDEEHANRMHGCSQAHLPAKPLCHRHWILQDIDCIKSDLLKSDLDPRGRGVKHDGKLSID